MAEDRAEPKVVLLVRLLSAIDEGRFTFEQLKDEIAEDKPPSTRTLRRYLSVLSDAGFPWYFDRAAGTYRFADGYSLRRFNLSHRELLGLVTLKRLGSSLGGTFASAIDETTEKLLRSSDRRSEVATSSFAIRMEQLALDPEVERAFDLLQTAERSRRRVTFGYTDKNGAATTRRADPYGFIVSSGRIYLVAFDQGRADMRVFAIDNVSDVVLTPQTYERPADFNLEAWGANSVSGVINAATLVDVTVRFSKVVAKAARAKQPAGERHVEDLPGGGIAITYRVADAMEIVRWTLGWGAEAEVIAPVDARAQAAAIAQDLHSRYTEKP